MIYSLTGVFGASKKFPCPWCDASLRDMDKFHMTSNFLPEISYFRGRKENDNWLRAETFNLMSLQRGAHKSLSLMIMVPPSIHIRLCVVNKFVKCLDAAVSPWTKKREWESSTNEPFSHAIDHLAEAMSAVEKKRDIYYQGAISGIPCTLLMQNTNRFCDIFFQAQVRDWDLCKNYIPSTAALNQDLRELDVIYNGFEMGGKGVVFFLKSQLKCPAEMLHFWDLIFPKFV